MSYSKSSIYRKRLIRASNSSINFVKPKRHVPAPFPMTLKSNTQQHYQKINAVRYRRTSQHISIKNRRVTRSVKVCLINHRSKKRLLLRRFNNKIKRIKSKTKNLRRKYKKHHNKIIKTFLKGRNYYLRKQREVIFCINKRRGKIVKIIKRKNLRRLPKRRRLRQLIKLKRIIKRNFAKVFKQHRLKRARPHFNSYLMKYLRDRRLRKRTSYKNLSTHWDYEDSIESENFYHLKGRIRKKELRRAKWSNKKKSNKDINYVRLSNRRFRPAEISIKHHRRNTFATLMDRVPQNDKNYNYVLFKSSSGFVGYPGPKKPTKYAREAVIEQLGHALAHFEITTIDINFVGNIGRKFYPYMKKIFQTLLYVKSIRVSKRRSHGFTRLKKAKRK